MKAYAFDKNKAEDTYELITLYKKRLEGKIGSPVKRAPKKECLELFGGSVNIEDFRKSSKPIFVHLPHEHFQIQIINNNQLKQQAAQPSNELQLKRVKPLERNKGRLETVLNKCSNAAKQERKNNSNLNTEQK
jgi:hypothetical protein